MKSTIKLFRAVPITTKKTKKATKALLKKTIERGFIFAPEVIGNYSNFDELIELVESVVGITGEKANSSFHKSWVKIKEADIEQLVMEQILHYITTYGFESLGIYDENTVYIPSEKLEVPKLKENVNLTVIKGLTKAQLKEKLLSLLDMGVALAEDTIDNVVEVALFTDLKEREIVKIKNKEVKSALYDLLDIVPKNAVEFLRFIVAKATEKTLLIKSPVIIAEIKEKKNLCIIKLFDKYEEKYGLEGLAEIFYRFKPIFLAFRTNKKLKITINRIRRLAVKNHKPLPEDYLNLITAKIKHGEAIENKKLKAELKKVNTFRKIRLAYALKFRTTDAESILYKIRNGKGYATDFEFKDKKLAKKVLDVVVDSIVSDVSKNVKGKKIYIPDVMNYALPATEKQFTGNFPSGSFVSVPKDIVFGVYWKNVDSHRIDLDLSLVNAEGKIGWDSSYRTSGRDVLFSGDVTDAKDGASELFYVQRQVKNSFILFVNYFNYSEDVEVPFKIMVAKELIKDFKENYMLNPNNMVAVSESTINQKQKVLGLIIVDSDECKFYFTEAYVGKSITSGTSELANNSRKYLISFYENTIGLKEILEKAGAKLVKTQKGSEIDLSPEALEKDSILNLLK